MISPMSDDREATLRARIEGDANLLVALVLESWTPAPDPMGDPMLLPRTDDDDPVRLDDLDWAGVRAVFRERHGRVAQSGARQMARTLLVERAARGGR
jgi:hypothetical protein